MSEPLRPRVTDLRAPALALARWIALLMGWVWLGEQGQRLGWSLASGVLAVALWWALRLVLAQRMWREAPARRTTLSLGVLAAAGAGFVARSDAGPASFWMLMALAALWAAWSAALDATAATANRCRRPWAGWPPVLAALISGSVLVMPVAQPLTGLPVSLVLLGGALLASATLPASPCRSPAPLTATGSLPQTAMGLMMGSLWLGSAWCANAGWSTPTVVGLHLLLMALLPGLVRLELVPHQLPPMARRALPLALVLAGGLLLWMEQTPANGMVGMVLLALAWALPVPAHAPVQTGLVRQQAVRWAPLGGPALLITVGAWSPTMGPQALALAYGGLSALAGLTLLAVLARETAQHLFRSTPPTTPRTGSASS
ncbi:hypothetical protein LPB72_17695 [Hydrogenophaga crassostreae]|uniref:Uncharacterized protein n=1 Tax=Hydrogenophaga crassostreae TaxID=1763535 RepID=A0A162SSR3_9BURK|nr:hypothetical protein [Hydrogenophaga crassostreae]AOW12827.1 hypothetical protein LPB072_08200 [Hydrogenophaga crassostreae]OAD40014.1 hypothetical protein LPB72_17695 [Hydrogenophaga crassostreae]